MPRRTPVNELLKEEPVASSPVRRSLRLNASSPAPVRTSTRRNSSEASSTSTPYLTRSRRSSLTQETEISEPEKKTAGVRTRRSSQTSEIDSEAPLRRSTRAASVTKELQEVKKPTTRRRRSVSEESDSVTKKDEPKARTVKKPESVKESSLSLIEENDKETSPVSTSKRRLTEKVDLDLSVINEEEMSPSKKAKTDKQGEELSPIRNKENTSSPKTKNDSSLESSQENNKVNEPSTDNVHSSPFRQVDPTKTEEIKNQVEDISAEINRFLSEKFSDGKKAGESKANDNVEEINISPNQKLSSNNDSEGKAQLTRLSFTNLEESGEIRDVTNNPIVLVEKISVKENEEIQGVVKSPKPSTPKKSPQKNKIEDNSLKERNSLNESAKDSEHFEEKAKSPQKRHSLNKSSIGIENLEEKVESPQKQSFLNKSSKEGQDLEETVDILTNSFDKSSKDEDCEVCQSVTKNEDIEAFKEKRNSLDKSSLETEKMESETIKTSLVVEELEKDKESIQISPSITVDLDLEVVNSNQSVILIAEKSDNEDTDVCILESKIPKTTEDLNQFEEKSTPEKSSEAKKEKTSENILNEDLNQFEEKSTPEKSSEAKKDKTSENILNEIAKISPIRKRHSKSSLTIQETVKIGEDAEESLSERIHKAVDLFCSAIKNNTSDLAVNVSLEYQEADSDEEMKKDVIEVSFTASNLSRSNVEESEELDEELASSSKTHNISERSKKETGKLEKGMEKKKNRAHDTSSKIIDSAKNEKKNKKNQSFEKFEADLVPWVSEVKKKIGEGSFKGNNKLIKEDLVPTRIFQGRIDKCGLHLKPSRGIRKFGKIINVKPSLKGCSVDWNVGPIVK